MIRRLIDIATGKAPVHAARSPKWPALRARHLKENPVCAACGGHLKLEVHHVYPFHDYPALELEPSNLVTLCESKRWGVNCHLFFGHAGDYKRSNPTVRYDAAAFRAKLDARFDWEAA